MSEGIRRYRFASGLATGLFLAFLLFGLVSALGDSGSGSDNGNAYSQNSAEKNTKEGERDGEWWGFAQRFVSSEDTLAQWLMTGIGLLAVGVSAWAVVWVRRTYVATRQMVIDTRDIGEKQTTAYLAIKSADAIVRSDRIIIEFVVRNFGSSEARNLKIKALVCHSVGPEPQGWREESIASEGDWFPFGFLAPGQELQRNSDSSVLGTDGTRVSSEHIAQIKSGERDYRLYGEIHFEDVFERHRRVGFSFRLEWHGEKVFLSLTDDGNYAS